jgi:hypothetical protein
MAASAEERVTNYEVNVEGVVKPWELPTITVSQIRQLGEFPVDQPVLEVNFDDQSERTLGENEIVEVKPGHGFAKKVGFKRG